MGFKAKEKDINILMVGGRRCGKTTVLAPLAVGALGDGISEILSLQSAKDGDVDPLSESRLLDAYSENEALFQDAVLKNNEWSYFTPDHNPNEGEDIYAFTVSLNNKNGQERDVRSRVIFHDVRGEAYTKYADEDNIRSNIEKSQVLIIAIDAVYLMEGRRNGEKFGPNHGEHNRVEEIERLIVDNFKAVTQKGKEKNTLILFVPIKCEKYYYAHVNGLNDASRYDMKAVAEAIQASYSGLIDFIKTDRFSNTCAAYILPVISLGGVIFSHFEADEEGVFWPKFRYYSNSPDGHPRYAPQYGTQPLIYALLFALKNTKASRFSLFGQANKSDLKSAINDLIPKAVKAPEPGFTCIQDPIGIFSEEK